MCIRDRFMALGVRCGSLYNAVGVMRQLRLAPSTPRSTLATSPFPRRRPEQPAVVDQRSVRVSLTSFYLISRELSACAARRPSPPWLRPVRHDSARSTYFVPIGRGRGELGRFMEQQFSSDKMKSDETR